MTNLRTVLSFNMKEKRKHLNLSQAELAEKIDTAPNYISKIEAEKQFPSVQMLEQIATALNCDTLDLFSTSTITRNNLINFREELSQDIIKLLEEKFEAIKF